MGMAIILSILLAAQPAIAAAPAPDWRPLGQTQGIAVAWDAAGIVRGDTLFVRVRFTPPTPGNTVFAYSITRVEMRCAPAPGEAHAVETANYRPDGTAGPIDRVAAPFVPVRPGSLFETLARNVCPALATAAPPRR